jgi:hypothetical protein
MSPEQAKGKPVDKRSDIWAFGVLLYEMLSGERLFQGETFSDTLAAVLRHDIDWRRIPPKVQPLLKKCLERDPKLRLRDIGDAWSLLELQKDSPSPVKTPTKWLPWSIAGGMTLALAGALFALWPERPPDRPLIRLSVDMGPDLSVSAAFTAVLSPDGSKVVYRVRTGEGKFSLAVRSLNEKNAMLLAGTEDAGGAPFFSPDGQWIGFSTGSQIKKVPVGGGAPLEIANLASIGATSWGKDGYVVTSAGPSNGLIRVLDRPGAMPHMLTELAAGEITHRSPQVLPDASAVLFTAASSYSGFDDATIQVVPVKTHKPLTLVTGGFAGRYVPSNGTRGHLIYVHQGTLFAIPFDPVRLEPRGKAAAIVTEIGSNTTGGAPRFDFSTDPSGTFRLSGRQHLPVEVANALAR